MPPSTKAMRNKKAIKLKTPKRVQWIKRPMHHPKSQKISNKLGNLSTRDQSIKRSIPRWNIILLGVVTKWKKKNGRAKLFYSYTSQLHYPIFHLYFLFFSQVLFCRDFFDLLSPLLRSCRHPINPPYFSKSPLI